MLSFGRWVLVWFFLLSEVSNLLEAGCGFFGQLDLSHNEFLVIFLPFSKEVQSTSWFSRGRVWMTWCITDDLRFTINFDSCSKRLENSNRFIEVSNRFIFLKSRLQNLNKFLKSPSKKRIQLLEYCVDANKLVCTAWSS